MTRVCIEQGVCHARRGGAHGWNTAYAAFYSFALGTPLLNSGVSTELTPPDTEIGIALRLRAFTPD